MSRRGRKYLNSSFFHTIVQGINKEYIFSEERFIQKYLSYFKKHAEELDVKIIAYCIMSNHAHFLLKPTNMENLSKLMQKTNSLYAKYYNNAKQRVGYVFRDRFLSEPITSHRYLIQCIKYIHLNPVKANMVKNCEEYKFSSYNYFLNNQKEIEKYEIFSEEDYINICNSNNCCKNFLDIDRNLKEDIENGIREFLIKKNLNLIDIYSERKNLGQLIRFLKEEEKIKYVEIGDFFEISAKAIQKLKC